ncbi:hypothetical protein B484DRAFT_406109 [Ochromonadaceae sp. CCMP2298]|nr:hypothetical protein B484DRAFT_406109 [Ochromonadaceae sp. CCMP2298]
MVRALGAVGTVGVVMSLCAVGTAGAVEVEGAVVAVSRLVCSKLGAIVAVHGVPAFNRDDRHWKVKIAPDQLVYKTKSALLERVEIDGEYASKVAYSVLYERVDMVSVVIEDEARAANGPDETKPELLIWEARR